MAFTIGWSPRWATNSISSVPPLTLDVEAPVKCRVGAGLGEDVEPGQHRLAFDQHVEDASSRLLSHDLRCVCVAPIAFFREAAAYAASGLHAGESVATQLAALRPWRARVLWAPALPAATILFVLERHAPSVIRRLRLRGFA